MFARSAKTGIDPYSPWPALHRYLRLHCRFRVEGVVSRPSRLLIDALSRLPGGLAVTSELTIAKLLAPTKTPTAPALDEKRAVYLGLLDQGHFMELVPITREILTERITIRRDHPRRIPDAIHIAMAISLGCRYFVSFDRDARRLPASLNWVSSIEEDVGELIETLLHA